MARPEVTGIKPRVSKDGAVLDNAARARDPPSADRFELPSPIRGRPVAREAYTIKEFCAAYRISEDFFFKMRRAGWAPAVMRVGTKVLISTAAAEAWRREREAAGARDLADA